MTGKAATLARLPKNGSITIRTRGGELELPELVARAGGRAAEASFEFFTARIPNAHTCDAKRRANEAGLPSSIRNHFFRATGITIHQEDGARLEDAQELPGHADMRTTQLYNRKSRQVARAKVERMQL